MSDMSNKIIEMHCKTIQELEARVKELEEEKKVLADIWFIRGIAMASGAVCFDEGQPSMAVTAMHDVTKQDFINADVPVFDMKKLKNAFAEMPQGEARYKKLLKKGDK